MRKAQFYLELPLQPNKCRCGFQLAQGLAWGALPVDAAPGHDVHNQSHGMGSEGTGGGDVVTVWAFGSPWSKTELPPA